MPWIESSFRARADANGRFEGEKNVQAPASGKLLEYKVTTKDGCRGRVHSTRLVIARVDDPNDMHELYLMANDCQEYQNDIDPPYRVHSGQSYVVRLSSAAFDPGEEIEGQAAIRYSLLIDLNKAMTIPHC